MTHKKLDELAIEYAVSEKHDEKHVECPDCGNVYWPTCMEAFKAGYQAREAEVASALIKQIQLRDTEIESLKKQIEMLERALISYSKSKIEGEAFIADAYFYEVYGESICNDPTLIAQDALEQLEEMRNKK